MKVFGRLVGHEKKSGFTFELFSSIGEMGGWGRILRAIQEKKEKWGRGSVIHTDRRKLLKINNEVTVGEPTS